MHMFVQWSAHWADHYRKIVGSNIKPKIKDWAKLQGTRLKSLATYLTRLCARTWEARSLDDIGALKPWVIYGTWLQLNIWELIPQSQVSWTRCSEEHLPHETGGRRWRATTCSGLGWFGVSQRCICPLKLYTVIPLTIPRMAAKVGLKREPSVEIHSLHDEPPATQDDHGISDQGETDIEDAGGVIWQQNYNSN